MQKAYKNEVYKPLHMPLYKYVCDGQDVCVCVCVGGCSHESDFRTVSKCDLVAISPF